MEMQQPERAEQRKAARKSLIATTAISVVLSFNQSTGLDWAVHLSGVSAWTFLLIAHGYYWAMWVMHDGMHQWRDRLAELFRKKHWRQSHLRPGIMHISLTIVFGFVGFAIIMVNLAWQTWIVFHPEIISDSFPVL